MQVNGNIPFHVARAYGVSAPKAPVAVARTEPVATVGPPAPVDRREPGPVPERIGELIGGRVSGPVDFATASSPSRPEATPPYQLYNRAADKIEIAVAVAVGRSIDVKG